VFTLAELVRDEGDGHEGREHDVGLVVAGEHAPEALDAAEEPLDLVASPVEFGVVLPGIEAGLLWGTTGSKPRDCTGQRVSLPS
jgi:hypothetical protein